MDSETNQELTKLQRQVLRGRFIMLLIFLMQSANTGWQVSHHNYGSGVFCAFVALFILAILMKNL